MDVSTAEDALRSVCDELSQAVERLTAHGRERDAEADSALAFAQALGTVAASLDCVRRELSEVWAGLEANAPALKRVALGSRGVRIGTEM